MSTPKKMSNEQKLAAILAELKKNSAGLGKTALAKAIGFSKADAVADVLDDAKNNGIIETDGTGSKLVYRLTDTGRDQANAVTSGAKKGSSKKSGEAALAEDASETKRLTQNLSAAQEGQITISGLIMHSKVKDGTRLFKKGGADKWIPVTKDQTLIVVNNEPKAIVAREKAAVAAIQLANTYAREKSFGTFNIVSGTANVSNEKDVTSSVEGYIVAVTVEKQNKAAL